MKWGISAFYILFLSSFLLTSAMEQKDEKKVAAKSLVEFCIQSIYLNLGKDTSEYDINQLNKKLREKYYPTIAYCIINNPEIKTMHKFSIIRFLISYPDEHKKKHERILNFFSDYLENNSHSYSTLLSVAVVNSVHPCVFKYLLNQRQQPTANTVWQLIGNQQHYPEIHDSMIKKLKSLLKKNPPIRPKESNLRPASTITPLMYAREMLACWHDDTWTRCFGPRHLFGCKTTLFETPSDEEITKYQHFFGRVVELLTQHEEQKNTTQN